jgi:hypothetical protein
MTKAKLIFLLALAVLAAFYVAGLAHKPGFGVHGFSDGVG